MSECYIIGSGPSLLTLSEEEKQHLNSSEKTLSLNQYLVHWRKVGIKPKKHIMADGYFPAIRLFVDTINEIRRLGESVEYFAHTNYQRYFPLRRNYRSLKHGLRLRLQTIRDFRYYVPYGIDCGRVRWFTQAAQMLPENAEIAVDAMWATSLQVPLFYWRGTLSSAINLANILWPGCNVKLLGIDLNSYGYFFDPEFGMKDNEKLSLFDKKRLSGVHADHHSKSRSLRTHATAVSFESKETRVLPGIQACFPFITKALERTGSSLFCCNPDSLLVTENVCAYAPIL
jgi:hypothetical protein